MAAKKKAKAKVGRPTKYRAEFARIAQRHCLLGATDPEVAELLGVSLSTVEKWKQQKPEFLRALKQGKSDADAKVVKSLYRRALGYSHPAVKILSVGRGDGLGSEVQQIPYTERYAPDTTAAIFWLKNRQPAEWRDRQEIAHDVTDNLAERLKAARERANLPTD